MVPVVWVKSLEKKTDKLHESKYVSQSGTSDVA